MATIGKERIMAVMTLTNAPPAELELPITAAESFVEGEIVFMSFGQLKEIAGDTPAQIYGVAKGGATALLAAGVDCPVWLANTQTLFAGNLLGTSAADHVSVASDIGRVHGIQRVTADSKVYLNSAVVGGANARVFVHGLARGSALGDTNARVLFSFLPGFYQAGATS